MRRPWLVAAATAAAFVCLIYATFCFGAVDPRQRDKSCATLAVPYYGGIADIAIDKRTLAGEAARIFMTALSAEMGRPVTIVRSVDVVLFWRGMIGILARSLYGDCITALISPDVAVRVFRRMRAAGYRARDGPREGDCTAYIPMPRSPHGYVA